MSKVIKGGTLVTADREWKSDILIEGEKIKKIGDEISNTTLPPENEVLPVCVSKFMLKILSFILFFVSPFWRIHNC